MSRLNPDLRRERIKLTGELPSPLNSPLGCAFNARCRRRFGTCTARFSRSWKATAISWWRASPSIRMKRSQADKHRLRGRRPLSRLRASFPVR